MVRRASAAQSSEAIEQILTSPGIFRGLEPGMDEEEIRATAKGGKVTKDGTLEYARELEWASENLVVYFDQARATILDYFLTLPADQKKLAGEIHKALEARFSVAHGKASKDRKYLEWSLADEQRPMRLVLRKSTKKQSFNADIGDYVPGRSELKVTFEIAS